MPITVKWSELKERGTSFCGGELCGKANRGDVGNLAMLSNASLKTKIPNSINKCEKIDSSHHFFHIAPSVSNNQHTLQCLLQGTQEWVLVSIGMVMAEMCAPGMTSAPWPCLE